jgi:hypothetical protein
LLLAGCGATAARYTSSPPGGSNAGPATAPAPSLTLTGPGTVPLPTPRSYVKLLSAQEAARDDVSLPWHTPGAPVVGRPFTATVDIEPCARLDGVHFTVAGSTVEVAMLGTKGSGPCTSERIVAVTRVAWPADVPPHSAVLHVPAER